MNPLQRNLWSVRREPADDLTPATPAPCRYVYMAYPDPWRGTMTREHAESLRDARNARAVQA